MIVYDVDGECVRGRGVAGGGKRPPLLRPSAPRFKPDVCRLEDHQDSSAAGCRWLRRVRRRPAR